LALIIAIGTFDVDAAIITLGGMVSDSIDRNLAGLALGGAVLANMLVKIGVVIVYAGFSRGRRAIIALSSTAATLAGTGTLTMMGS
jgi:endonuclease YncB( thermonuclease family)